MKGLVYISRATNPFSEDELTQLAQTAAARNKNNNITGYLSYDSEDRFIQYIESEETDLQQLFDSIYRDNRHRITHYIRHDIEQRKFTGWGMRLIMDHEFKDIHDLMINHLFHISSAPSMVTYKSKLIWSTVDTLADASHVQH
ncbi:MAG: BLUF domain-containing protein [Gammaproteobacteria bacterium]